MRLECVLFVPAVGYQGEIILINLTSIWLIFRYGNTTVLVCPAAYAMLFVKYFMSQSIRTLFDVHLFNACTPIGCSASRDK